MAQIVGRSNEIMDVLSDGSGVVQATTLSQLAKASEEGRAFSWVSAATDIDTTDTRLFVKNTGTAPLHVSYLRFNGSNVICQWTVLKGSAATTPTGTLVTGANLNFGSAKVAAAISYDDETAVADGTVIDRVWTPITNTLTVDMSEVILTTGTYIQINQITESTSGSVILRGWFEA